MVAITKWKLASYIPNIRIFFALLLCLHATDPILIALLLDEPLVKSDLVIEVDAVPYYYILTHLFLDVTLADAKLVYQLTHTGDSSKPPRKIRRDQCFLMDKR